MIAVAARPREGIPCVNTANTAVKPGYTPSLLEQMPVPKYTGPAWIAFCKKAVADSQAYRKGVKGHQTPTAPIYEGFWANKVGVPRAAS